MKIEDEGMSKFGVDETPTFNEKLGSKTARCPVCGSKCDRHGDILVCPVHGTEPFERG